ncbi:hypothetical protein BDZ89DRAFT_1053959 [Hymenopellis radicata]|nr:hypothetical protein BDZ89DRAFT_1053959 [Hymenopellis radicata]
MTATREISRVGGHDFSVYLMIPMLTSPLRIVHRCPERRQAHSIRDRMPDPDNRTVIEHCSASLSSFLTTTTSLATDSESSHIVTETDFVSSPYSLTLFAGLKSPGGPTGRVSPPTRPQICDDNDEDPSWVRGLRSTTMGHDALLSADRRHLQATDVYCREPQQQHDDNSTSMTTALHFRDDDGTPPQ